MTRNPALEDALRPLVEKLVEEALAKRAAEPSDDYLTIAAAAELASVAPSTVRRWISSGRLASARVERIIRIRRADLDAMLRSGRRTAAANANLSPEALARLDFG